MVDETKTLQQWIHSVVRKTIKRTITKFRENPFYFFTESDIHSYFYHALYSGKLEIKRGTKRIYLVHREYPTNFRYSKEALLLEDYKEPYSLASRQGDRGNYDIAVINPVYVHNAKTIEDIVNKSVRLLEKRLRIDREAVLGELLHAIEFKYVIRNDYKFVTEVLQDNKKLLFGTRWGARTAINLVFCNIEGSHIERIREAVRTAPEEILAVFVQAYYRGEDKVTPKPITNHGRNGIDQFLG